MTDAAPATVPVVRESTEPGAISAEPPSGRETDPDDDAAHGAPPIRAAMPVVRESTDPSAVSVQGRRAVGRETADEVLASLSHRGRAQNLRAAPHIRRSAMARTKKKKRKKRAAAPRVQVPRACAEPLALLLSGNVHHRLELTLGDAVRHLWAYARRKGLNQGSTISCDAAMRELFGVDSLGMTAIPGALSAHMTGTGGSSAAAAATSTSAASTSTAAASSSSSSSAATGRGAALVAAAAGPRLALSEALAAILCDDSEEPHLTVQEAIRRLGGYASRHRLRDESDRRRVRCDAPLRAALGVTDFTVFEARGLLLGRMRTLPSASAAAAADEDATEALRRAVGEQTAALGEIKREAAAAAAAAGGKEAMSDGDRARFRDLYRDVRSQLASLKEQLASAEASTASGTKARAAAAAADAAAAAEAESAAAAALHAAAAPAPAAAPSGGGGGTAPPSEYLCSITQEVMRDPVSTADGHTYERDAIERWLRTRRTSPMTGATLSSRALIPNLALRKLCREWAARNPPTPNSRPAPSSG